MSPRRAPPQPDDLAMPPALIGLLLVFAVALAIAFLVAAQAVQTP